MSIEGPSGIREGTEDSQELKLIEGWYEVLVELDSLVDAEEFLTRIEKGREEVERVIQLARNELDPESEEDREWNLKLNALAKCLGIDIGSEFDPSEGTPEMGGLEGEDDEE